MSALPSDIGLYTHDGVVVTARDTTIQATFAGAQTDGDNPRELFFDTVVDGQEAINQMFVLLSVFSSFHAGLDIEDNLGLGTTVPLTGIVPTFLVTNASSNLSVQARCRAIVFDYETDRTQIEVIG